MPDAAGDWVGTGTGLGDTLPDEAGGETVVSAGRELLAAGASRGAGMLVEGGSVWRLEDTWPGSGSAAGWWRCPPPWACLSSLKACWSVPDGADRDRPILPGPAGRGGTAEIMY